VNLRTLLPLLLLVGAPASAEDWRTMLSPGVLGPAHADLAGDCDACHMQFAGIPDVKCLGCHEGLAGRISSNVGYHATLGDRRCIDCHVDHGGSNDAMTRDDARAAFDHDATGFTLDGAHSGQTCEDCHTKPVHELDGGCMDCHEDAHSSALGPSCNSCHTPVAWTAGLRLLTDHLLSMEGKHGEQTCADCHTHGEHLDLTTRCSDCHEEAHGGVKTDCGHCHEVTGFKPARFDHGPCTCAFPGKHQTVACLACHEDYDFVDTPIVCSGCHLEERTHDDLGECSVCHTATSWTENLFDHNRQSAFRIEGAHEAVSCAQCHADGNFKGAPTDCASCHQAMGDEAHGPFGACEQCHTTVGFDQSTFDHATTGFVLSGRHQTLDCKACHAEQTADYPTVRSPPPR
jgi:hypothetical protein